MSKTPISSTPAVTPVTICHHPTGELISTAGTIRHTIDAVSIMPAQNPRKMSFHLWGIFLTINPIIDPNSEDSPSPAAHIHSSLIPL